MKKKIMDSPFHERHPDYKKFGDMVRKEFNITDDVEVEKLVTKGMKLFSRLDLKSRIIYLQHQDEIDQSYYPFLENHDFLNIIKERLNISFEDAKDVIDIRMNKVCRTLKMDADLFYNIMEKVYKEHLNKEERDKFIREHYSRYYDGN